MLEGENSNIMFNKIFEKFLNFPHKRKYIDHLMETIDGLIYVEIECLDRCGHCRSMPVVLMDDKSYKVVCYNNQCFNSTNDYDDLLKCCIEWNLRQRFIADKI